MSTRTTALVLVLLGGCATLAQPAGVAATIQPQPAVPSIEDAAALGVFDRKIAEYVALHRKLEGTVPTVDVSEDPAEVRAAVDALAVKIQSARRDVPAGAIFTEEVARVFRRLISQGCAGDYETLLELVMEETPRNLPEPTANGRWPAGVPFSLMTPDMLCALPELPPELEYRFIHRHLVLHDTHANLIVDVLRNAIPLPGQTR